MELPLLRRSSCLSRTRAKAPAASGGASLIDRQLDRRNNGSSMNGAPRWQPVKGTLPATTGVRDRDLPLDFTPD